LPPDGSADVIAGRDVQLCVHIDPLGVCQAEPAAAGCARPTGRVVTLLMVGLRMQWVPFIRYLSSEVIYLQASGICQPDCRCHIQRLLARGPPRDRVACKRPFSRPIHLRVESIKSTGSGSPLFSWLVSINFLHFAIIIFVVSAAILIVVSLATQPESEPRLRGLTFATLKGGYAPARNRTVFAQQIVASTALLMFVFGLWIYFA
jgi:SSS family solute:Na+ symporter